MDATGEMSCNLILLDIDISFGFDKLIAKYQWPLQAREPSTT